VEEARTATEEILAGNLAECPLKGERSRHHDNFLFELGGTPLLSTQLLPSRYRRGISE